MAKRAFCGVWTISMVKNYEEVLQTLPVFYETDE